MSYPSGLSPSFHLKSPSKGNLDLPMKRKEHASTLTHARKKLRSSVMVVLLVEILLLIHQCLLSLMVFALFISDAQVLDDVVIG